MAKIISIDEFKIQIEKIRIELENIENPTPNLLSLIALMKRELRHFDENMWKKKTPGSSATVADVFRENLIFSLSTIEKAIIFLLYSYQIEKIDDDFLDNVNFIATALAKTGVTPHNYRKYLNMFTHPDVTEYLFTRYDEQTSDILVASIHLISQEELDAGNYRTVIEYICAIKNRHYSPVFYNYYTIDNVRETLEFIVTDEKNALFFTPADKRNIESLKELDAIATKEFRDYFKEQIMETETLCAGKQVTLVKAICAMIPSMLMKAYRQMSVPTPASHANKPK